MNKIFLLNINNSINSIKKYYPLNLLSTDLNTEIIFHLLIFLLIKSFNRKKNKH